MNWIMVSQRVSTLCEELTSTRYSLRLDFATAASYRIAASPAGRSRRSPKKLNSNVFSRGDVNKKNRRRGSDRTGGPEPRIAQIRPIARIAHIAPNCFKYFSEFAFVAAGGFILSDFLKLTIAFFLSPFNAYASPKLSKTFALFG